MSKVLHFAVKISFFFLKVNLVNFVSAYTLVKFLFVYLSVYLFGCLFIPPSFLLVCRYHVFGEIKIYIYKTLALSGRETTARLM